VKIIYQTPTRLVVRDGSVFWRYDDIFDKATGQFTHRFHSIIRESNEMYPLNSIKTIRLVSFFPLEDSRLTGNSFKLFLCFIDGSILPLSVWVEQGVANRIKLVTPERFNMFGSTIAQFLGVPLENTLSTRQERVVMLGRRIIRADELGPDTIKIFQK